MPISHTRVWRALDRLAESAGLSPSGLARKAGLDATTFNPSKRFGPPPERRPRWPSTESLARALSALGVTLSEFADLAEDAAGRPRLPFVGLALAGTHLIFDDEGTPSGAGWGETDLPSPRPGMFSVGIVGDSMAPAFREGDRVVVDRSPGPIRKGDRVVVRLTNGETLAKEISRVTTRALTLSSINPAYPPRTVARDEIAWIGRIDWVSQ